MKSKLTILISAALALCALSFTAAVRTQYFGSVRHDANGLWVGQATTDKVGFFGKAPVVQPSGAAQAALTDSTGGTADGTLADGITTTALTDNSGGAAADGTIGAVTAPTALTVTDGAGTNDGTIGAITADASVIAAVQELAAAQGADRTAIIALTDAVKELSTQLNAVRIDVSAQNDNDKELVTLLHALRTALSNGKLGLIKGGS